MTKRDRRNICVLIAKCLINKSNKSWLLSYFFKQCCLMRVFKKNYVSHTCVVNYRKIIKLCRWFMAMPIKCPYILRFPLKKHNSRFTMVVICTWYKVPNLQKLLFNLSYNVWLCKLEKVYLFRKLFLLKSWIDVPDILS
jgi:hypothetical protein